MVTLSQRLRDFIGLRPVGFRIEVHRRCMHRHAALSYVAEHNAILTR